MPGSGFSFRLALDPHQDAGSTPDEFTFAILDGTGLELPTKSLFDVFILIDIDSPCPIVNTFGADTSRLPNAGGTAIAIAAPIATPANSPEPVSWVLLIAGLGGIACARRYANSR